MIPLASTVGDIAAGVAALATVGLFLAACYAGHLANRQLRALYKQLEAQGKTEGRRRVFEHLKQLSDRNFIKMDTEAQRLFREQPSDPADWLTIWNSRSDSAKYRIAAAMNFYEVLAGDYNDPGGEVLDRETADRALAYIADGMWLLAKPFVYWLREHFGDERAYAEWELLHRTFTQTADVEASAPREDPKPPSAAPETSAAALIPSGTPSASKSGPPPPTQHSPSQAQGECPPNPCVLMPKRIIVVALLWTVAIVASFFAYIEIDAVADFFPSKIDSLPFSSIWFGAVGGLLVSLEGIFKHNHSWLRSYDYWHYLRPLLGAIMGTLGCLIFVVLTSAAASSQPPTPDPAFYAVIALSLGYREKHFRELLMRLVDTIIVPNQTEKSGATAEANQPPEGA